MGRQISQNGNRETLEDARARVMRRSWKHYAVSAAIVGSTAFGVAEGGKLIAESQNNSPSQSHPTDGGKLGAGLLWLALTGLGGLAGGVVMLPRLVRNQRSLEIIEENQRAGRTHIRVSGRKSIYQKNADGQYETFGEGHERVQKKMRMEFAGAAGLAITGTALVLDTVFSNRLALTETIMPLVRDHVASAQALATITEGFASVASLAGAIKLTVAGNSNSKLRTRIEDDILHYGENGRIFKRNQPSDAVKKNVEPA